MELSRLADALVCLTMGDAERRWPWECTAAALDARTVSAMQAVCNERLTLLRKLG